MIDGRFVAGCLRLTLAGHTADQGGEIGDLVARLRALVLTRVGDAALAVLDDGRAAPGALARVARAIEEAGRHDPAFAREITRLCDEIARRGAQPLPWPSPSLTCPRCGHATRPEHAFCDHCGSFLEWAPGSIPANSQPPETHRGEPTPPVVTPPAGQGTGSEQAVKAPTAPAAQRPFPRSRTARGRLNIWVDSSTKLE